MKTALYVFLAILAAYAVISIFERTEVILDKLDDLLEKVDQIEDSIINDSKND